MINPFTKEEILKDLQSLRQDGSDCFYKRPLGQLYLGVVPTDYHYKKDTVVKTINTRIGEVSKTILVLEHLDVSPSRLIDRLLVDDNDTISERTIQDTLQKIRTARAILLMGAIEPSSINSLTGRLEEKGYSGEVTVIEKEADIVRMLKPNLEPRKSITVNIKLGNALNHGIEPDIVFCDVLGRYLSDRELKLDFPNALDKVKTGGMAFISDVNQLGKITDSLTRTCGMSGGLQEYEQLFKDWFEKNGYSTAENEVIQIRRRLFYNNDKDAYANLLMEWYTALLGHFKLIRSVAVTTKGYVENNKVSRYFDYMLFQKVA